MGTYACLAYLVSQLIAYHNAPQKSDEPHVSYLLTVDDLERVGLSHREINHLQKLRHAYRAGTLTEDLPDGEAHPFASGFANPPEPEI